MAFDRMPLPNNFTQQGAIQYLMQVLSQMQQSRLQRAGSSAARSYGASFNSWMNQRPQQYGPSREGWTRFLGNRYGFNARGEPDVPSYQLPGVYQRLRARPEEQRTMFDQSEEGNIAYKYPYLTPNYNSGYGPVYSWEMMR